MKIQFNKICDCRSLLSILSVAVLSFALSPMAWAQSTTTGAVTGRVSDPSGAVLPHAQVTMKNMATGALRTTQTDSSGLYNFQFAEPGTYTISVKARGFNLATALTTVSVGGVTAVNLTLQLASAKQSVTVEAEAPVVQTTNGNVSQTISPLQVSEVPNPGNDLSFLAQMAPGAVMNTQMGYGNFAMYGMPATSNNFTMDGMNDDDPFLNLNNSGPTNLLLGQNDVGEASVVTNGYSGQYGGLAGAQVNYISKHGGNQWHGNAYWEWNGRYMNANPFFNNASNLPRPFDNANAYATSIGGPIHKNKAFVFVDYEGLNVILPTSPFTIVPSAAFEQATRTNLTNLGLTSSIPYYNTMFNLYNTAPGSSKATNFGCDNITPAQLTAAGLPSTFTDCTNSYYGNNSDLTHEWQLSERFDFNLGNNDRLFIRQQYDTGVQATYTDAINSVFNARSTQPEFQTQLGETHTFGGTMVNSLRVFANWYSAIFTTSNLKASLAAFPTTMLMNDGSLSSIGGEDFAWPQGRKVTQYGFVDDFSWTKGNETFKFGGSLNRYDISDFDYGSFTSGLEIPFTLSDFFSGGSTGSFYEATYPSSGVQAMNTYKVGAYAEEDWHAKPGLTFTIALRADVPVNPTCRRNCFATFASSWPTLNHSATIPYNQAITTGVHQAFNGFTTVGWEPRVGFAWQPLGTDHNTVLRGGIGIFYDAFPGFIADSLSENPPLDNTFLSFFDNLSPAAATNLIADANASNATFHSQFSGGGTWASMFGSTPYGGPGFTGIQANPRDPYYTEYNLELQQGIGRKMRVTLNYVGNHGVHEDYLDPGVNASNPFATPFAGLPSAPTDPRFGTVSLAQTNAVSYYDGLVASFRRAFQRGFIQVNYQWSHALDEISNQGLLPFNFGINESSLAPQNPFNIQSSYGPADYDVRQYVSASYVYQLPIREMFGGRGADALVNGWQLSGTLFARTGYPLTAIDSNLQSTLSTAGYGSSGGDQARAFLVSGGEAPCYTPDKPCMTLSQFAESNSAFVPSGFSPTQRNFFRGPDYFDTDMTIVKYTTIPGWESAKLAIGLQFYNLFNHPNFDQPVDNVASSNFGKIISTVNPPTSILGSFLGGNASPRMIQTKIELTF